MTEPQTLQWNPASTPIPKPMPNTALLIAEIGSNLLPLFEYKVCKSTQKPIYRCEWDRFWFDKYEEHSLIEDNYPDSEYEYVWMIVTLPNLPQP